MSTTTEIILDTKLKQCISAEQAWLYKIIPKELNANSIVLFADETYWDDDWKDELEIVFAKKVFIDKVPTQQINEALGKNYRKQKRNSVQNQINFESDDFIFQIISEANGIGSSDIHIERYEEKSRIRMRIDGKLVEQYIIPDHQYSSIINKLKIKSNLDIAEKRLPQDGRINFEKGADKFDIRVSIVPTLYGEKVVMRLLSKSATNIDLETLGFNDLELTNYLEGVKKSHGMVLISGPTGSGKTTTLYATLKLLNNSDTNILTIEDPIEYTLEGINQVQLKENIGLNFSSALKSFLRQDPDIIMLGEIRDADTAQMAIRASLTGHMVLSTIHTNSAWGTISRLIDMGVPSYLLASTINITAAQRLVRLVCPSCKELKPTDKSLFPKNFNVPKELTKHAIGNGCEACHYTGYSGRKAIYEIIPIDSDLANCIKSNDFEINQYLKDKNIKSLLENAFELLLNQETSIEEVYSILMNSN